MGGAIASAASLAQADKILAAYTYLRFSGHALMPGNAVAGHKLK
jgi:hypothetical protein